ncbi:MAG: hypothetical protein HKN18_18455 [Silicimonas sp.]|nr:hypothetical protein [Silicimonas sp.]
MSLYVVAFVLVSSLLGSAFALAGKLRHKNKASQSEACEDSLADEALENRYSKLVTDREEVFSTAV